MPFDAKFTNPFQDPANVPPQYRQHAALQKLFKADGSYVRPAEDPVTMWAIDLLAREYGVPLDAMELELHADFSEGTYQGGRRYQGRADVVIYDDRYAVGDLDVAFIMVEAMEPGKKFEGDDPEGWVEHLNRLNAYMSASPSARYAILTSGHHTVIYRRDLEYPRKLEPIGDLPKYESARLAAQHSPYKVILNPDQPDGIETGLQPLTRDKFREVLGDTRSGCHSLLRDNEGLQPQEAVDAMVKFLFAKWYDEQATIDLVKADRATRGPTFSASAPRPTRSVCWSRCARPSSRPSSGNATRCRNGSAPTWAAALHSARPTFCSSSRTPPVRSSSVCSRGACGARQPTSRAACSRISSARPSAMTWGNTSPRRRSST